MKGRFWIYGLFGLLVGCSSVSTFENGRTLPVGKIRGAIGFSMIKSDQVSETVGDTEGKSEFLIPLVDVDVRFGLATHLDMGVRWSTPGNLSTRLKYELIPGDHIAFAFGIGVGYLGNLKAFEAVLPVYLSWDIHAQFGLYTVASYRLRLSAFSDFVAGELAVFGAGIRIGNAIGVMLELNHLVELGRTFRGYQGGISFFFGDGPSAKFRLGREGHEVRWRRGKLDDLDEGHEPYGSKVLQASQKGWVAVVEHEGMRFWKVGEELCIFDQQSLKPKGCGPVVKVNKTGAVLKFIKPVRGIRPGDQVRTALDPTPLKRAPEPEVGL